MRVTLSITTAAWLTILFAVAVPTVQADALFENQTPIKASLSMPLKLLLRNKQAGVEFQGTWKMDDQEFAVIVSKRGKSRLKHCKFPPLWLDFDKPALQNSMLAGQNKLKLVTHCSDKLEPRGYLAAEMLAYRLLNVLTDHSFRVKAVELTYIDGDTQKESVHHGFLIEHKKRLAKRLQAQLLKVPKLSLRQLAPEPAAVLNLFQYLLANTDFSASQGPKGDNCCHNTVPIKLDNEGIYPVAYDFDSSGFVDPPYASPSPALKLKRLTQRKYRGFCSQNSTVDSAVDVFKDKKSKLYDTIQQFEDIPNLRVDRITKFVDKFYTIIESPKLLQRRIVGKCRKG